MRRIFETGVKEAFKILTEGKHPAKAAKKVIETAEKVAKTLK